ncbi:MAG: DUF4835 family protein [Candidatus Kapaibacterium sp.]
MKFSSTIALLAILIAGVCAPTLMAQEIDATVSFNADQLPLIGRQEVAGFADEMQRYINSTRWTDGPWEGEKVKMNFSVVFSASSDNAYGAKLLIGSQRTLNKSEKLSPMMKVLDEGWSFHYNRNQPFIQDLSRYDELTGLIDFYVYIALGLDLDSYAYLGGSSQFEKAWALAQRAQVRTDLSGWGTQTSSGTYSRYGFIRELTDLRFNPIRKFIYDYHYNGLDLINENRAVALDSISNHLSNLVIAVDRLVAPSVVMRVLNDSKDVEYAEIFTGYGDPLIWKKLLYLDPGHQSVYENARNR